MVAAESSSIKINLADAIEEMFMVLTTKEKDVIVQRFSLDNKPKRTLESIGQQFSVTRERVRQIEKIALGKLRRTVQTTKLHLVNDIADQVIKEFGGVLLETKLVSKILTIISSKEEIDVSIIRLALNINPHLEQEEKNNVYEPFWRLKDLQMAFISSVIDAGIKILKKKTDVTPDNKLVVQVRQALGSSVENYSDPMIVSSLEVDKRVKKTSEGFGLMTWRHIIREVLGIKLILCLKKRKILCISLK
ncbi:hypothetical protein HZC20_03390 [Candidatus Peregrinibacteria bacterium]|nr:hypothetical protein [Candidatus Peregrinibacteria bacterium]